MEYKSRKFPNSEVPKKFVSKAFKNEPDLKYLVRERLGDSTTFYFRKDTNEGDTGEKLVLAKNKNCVTFVREVTAEQEEAEVKPQTKAKKRKETSQLTPKKEHKRLKEFHEIASTCGLETEFTEENVMLTF